VEVTLDALLPLPLDALPSWPYTWQMALRLLAL
jgi:hypothetical protein